MSGDNNMRGAVAFSPESGKGNSVVPEESSILGGQALLKRYKKQLRVEIVGLCVLMAVVWALLTLPIVFYYLPTSVDQDLNNNMTTFENETEFKDGPLECREDFFREEYFNTCVPICPDWSEDNKAISTTIDVVIGISYSTGFIIGIVIVVISIIRRKTMLSFPNSLVVCLTVVYIFQNFFYIATFFDRANLYCSSKNLFVSFTHVTPFCVISGMVQVYSTLSAAIWWLMLTVSLFWKLWFPFNARLRESKKQIKYIHIGCILIGVLVPLIPIITLMSSYSVRLKSNPSNITFLSGGLGFTSVRSPPVPCNGNSKAVIFYTNILPADVMLAVGITLIILIFWLVHKQHTMFKASHRKNPFSINTTEQKLLLIFCYYVISTVINLTAFSVFASKSDIFQIELNQYFTCELGGHDPANPCDRGKFENILSEVPVILSYALHGILPLFNLIFVVNFQKIKAKLFRAKRSAVSEIKKTQETGF